jgi:hypothetical protein
MTNANARIGSVDVEEYLYFGCHGVEGCPAEKNIVYWLRAGLFTDKYSYLLALNQKSQFELFETPPAHLSGKQGRQVCSFQKQNICGFLSSVVNRFKRCGG